MVGLLTRPIVVIKLTMETDPSSSSSIYICVDDFWLFGVCPILLFSLTLPSALDPAEVVESNV